MERLRRSRPHAFSLASFPTNNAILVNFRLSSDADFFVVDKHRPTWLTSGRRTCKIRVSNVWVSQLSFHFAYRRCWLGTRGVSPACLRERRVGLEGHETRRGKKALLPRYQCVCVCVCGCARPTNVGTTRAATPTATPLGVGGRILGCSSPPPSLEIPRGAHQPGNLVLYFFSTKLAQYNIGWVPMNL